MKACSTVCLLLLISLPISCSSESTQTTIVVTKVHTPTPLVVVVNESGDVVPASDYTPTPVVVVVSESGQVVPASDYTPSPVTAGTGSIVGHVYYRCNGEPAENYHVYIFRGGEGDAVAYGRVKVDSEGRYEAHGLSANEYRLTGSKRADLRATTNVDARVTVRDHETTVADDILVDECPDIRLLRPGHSEAVTTRRPTFAWEPYPGDVVYVVRVFPDGNRPFSFPKYPETTTETSLTAPEDLGVGAHEWSVIVYEAGRDLSLGRIGESPSASFTIESP